MAEVIRLSPAELRQGREVALEGVATAVDSRLGLLVVQDGTGGVLVSRPRGDQVVPGDLLSVKGFSAHRGFAPIVVKARVQRLGPGTMPEPIQADTESLFRGSLDFRFVELECRIRSSFAPEIHRFQMDAEKEGHAFRISGTGDFAPQLLSSFLAGARAHVRGVPVTTYSPSGRPYSLQLFAGGPDTIVPLSATDGTQPHPAREPGEGMPPLPELTSVAQVKALTNPEAGRGYPVRLRAVVTNWDQDRFAFFAQDETAAVYVIPQESPPPPVVAGDRVEMEGRTMIGSFAPIVYASSVSVSGHGPRPEPLKPSLSGMMEAGDENAWAEVGGVVQAVHQSEPGITHLTLAADSARVLVIVQAGLSSEERSRLENTRVRVRGIFSPLFTVDGRLTGFRLLTPSFEDVEILEVLGGDTFEAAARPIGSLLGYRPTQDSLDRVKIAGLVTYVGFHGDTYLEDETGGIRLRDLPAGTAGVGATLEVLGFLAGQWQQASFAAVEARVTGADSSLEPRAITATDAQSGLYDARLVRLEGFLRGRRQRDGDRVFDLQAGRVDFTAVLEHPQTFSEWEELREGALLQLTGVSAVDWDANALPPSPESFRLLLRSPGDIVLLRRAPWWTLGRALVVAGSLLGALAVAALWAATLRRRVAAQTSLIKKQMKDRTSLEAQLRQMQRLESIGRLAGGIAHDFNNLLVVIGGNSELLRRQLAGQERALARVDQIKKAGEAAASLTRQLLAVSRQQILRPAVVDLNRLLSDLDEMLRRLIGEDIEMVSILSPDPLPILVDSGQIGQVVMNLVVNARDAMPDGGALTLETESVFLDEGYAAEHAGISPGHHALLTVSDTGVGMDEDTRSRVFEPFFTTKGPGEGTGLGLATAFGVIKQSGGHIWVYSEPGQGTTIKVYLPRAQGPPETGRPPAQPVTRREGSETVLVVEDNAAVRQLAVDTLSDLGYEVLDAPTGEDALVLANHHPGDIHLLLTDVVLPGMNGRQLADQLTGRRPGLRTLFASGYTHNIIAHKGVLDSGINFLSKPYSAEELGTAVRAVLDEG